MDPNYTYFLIIQLKNDDASVMKVFSSDTYKWTFERNTLDELSYILINELNGNSTECYPLSSLLYFKETRTKKGEKHDH